MNRYFVSFKYFSFKYYYIPNVCCVCYVSWKRDFTYTSNNVLKSQKSVEFLVGHYHKLNNCQISSKSVLFAKTRKI